MKRALLCMMAILAVATISAKVKLPAMVGDNMVLQRNATVNLWGWGDAGKMVTVTTSWGNRAQTVKVGQDGRWLIKVATPDAGGPYNVRISDGQPIDLQNIMIGEVWVCSGQSNMEMPMSGYYSEAIDGAMGTLMTATRYKDKIRMITVPKDGQPSELKEDFEGAWKSSDASSAASCSATAYYFARNLVDAMDIPVGLIVTSWGGSSIETWIDEKTAESVPGLDMNYVRSVKHPNQGLAYLYNGMVWPVKNFTAKGFIWYQGESNIDRPVQYAATQKAMVEKWRELWGDAAMPFYFVQIAPHSYGRSNDFKVGYIVEAQMKAAQITPNSAMIPTSDIGNEHSIHPPQKDVVGQRLAALALTETYGVQGFSARGLTYQGVKFEGGAAVVEFDSRNGFMPRSGEVTGFEIAGLDKIFYPATATVVWGSNKVKVSSTEVPEPVAVRYAFRNYMESNLKTTYALPAYPFRTDNW